MENTRFTKSHFTWKITTLDKDNKVSKVEKIPSRGSDFQRSIITCIAAGMPRKIELVEKEPEQFQLNTLYVRLDGKYVWTWIQPEVKSETVESNVESST